MPPLIFSRFSTFSLTPFFFFHFRHFDAMPLCLFSPHFDADYFRFRFIDTLSFSSSTLFSFRHATPRHCRAIAIAAISIFRRATVCHAPPLRRRHAPPRVRGASLRAAAVQPRMR
jgi:hypothetical protein